MFPLPEQFSSAAKSQLESQLQIFSTLTSKVFESAEKIIALNLNAGKAAISHTAETAQHLLARRTRATSSATAPARPSRISKACWRIAASCSASPRAPRLNCWPRPRPASMPPHLLPSRQRPSRRWPLYLLRRRLRPSRPPHRHRHRYQWQQHLRPPPSRSKWPSLPPRPPPPLLLRQQPSQRQHQPRLPRRLPTSPP